jgi:alkaline phosphatase D
MKIAFTSCADPLADPDQPVWDRIAEQSPDVLLLLGDNIYMDYGLFGHDRLGWPRKIPLQEFANELYLRYRAQFAIASFQRLLALRPRIGLTWDDHDFAWNNARGAGTDAKYAVSRDKRLVSRALCVQFREAIQAPRTAYPALPPLSELLSTPDTGIQTTFDIETVRFILLDGRTYREDPNQQPDAEMHGRAQRDWLATQLAPWNGLKIVGSGSVMTHSRESWDQYVDYAWLVQKAPSSTIVLTGDIHKNVLPVRHAAGLIEITCSGAARPDIGGARGNFGTIEMEPAPMARLYSTDHPEGIAAAIAF